VRTAHATAAEARPIGYKKKPLLGGFTIYYPQHFSNEQKKGCAASDATSLTSG
jgi:hypothetical protein